MHGCIMLKVVQPSEVKGMLDKSKLSRRRLLQSSLALSATACVKKPDFCEQPAIVSDGEFRTADVCTATASNIEGPFYITDAPERSNFRLWGDDGVSVSLSGRVVSGDCSMGLDGAIVEFGTPTLQGATTIPPQRCVIEGQYRSRAQGLTRLRPFCQVGT